MIRIGIVGCNYGRSVHVPAFRSDPRCTVIGLAGSDLARTTAAAQAVNIPLAWGNWTELVEHPDVDAVTIAAPPSLQPAIAVRALELGKPVFAEKPIAADLAAAEAMARAAAASGQPTMVDFNFSAILTWRRAKALLDEGVIGRLRHVVVSWNVENYATRMRIMNWKSLGENGGGVLGNFVSHSFSYLEWLCGPIIGMSARLSGLPDEPMTETNAHINLAFRSGAAGNLAVSCASFLGSGHRLEFYGEDGTMMLVNETPDYMRGFKLSLARRSVGVMTPIEVVDPTDLNFPADGRVAPVSRLATEFLNAIQSGQPAVPGFAEGLRVQVLLDAARRASNVGCWLDLAT